MRCKKMGQIFFKICKFPFFNIWKLWEAKNWAEFFLRFVSTRFLIFEMWISKKWGQVFLRFVSIPFLLFGKGGKLKIGPGFSEDLLVYFFKNILKRWSAKNWARFIVRFVRTLFLVFKNGITKKLSYVFWTFLSTLLLIFEKRDQQKIGPGSF